MDVFSDPGLVVVLLLDVDAEVDAVDAVAAVCGTAGVCLVTAWLVFCRAPANPLSPKNGAAGGFPFVCCCCVCDWLLESSDTRPSRPTPPCKPAVEDLNNDDANTVVLALSTSSTFCFSSEKRNIPMNSLARARGSVNLGPTFSMNPIRVLTLKVMSMSAMRCADVKR
jgi:hypothetical protein